MQRLTISLALVASLAGVARANPEDPDPGACRKGTAAWVAASGGALLLAGLTVSLYERGEYYQSIAKYEVATDDAKTRARDDANHAVLVTRYAGTGLFLAGAAAVGIGAVLYFTAPAKRERAYALVPAAGADHIGLALTGGF